MPNDKQPYVLANQITYELNATRTLFRDVQVSLAVGDRVALVGANGIGKSTLLKLLAGQLLPTTGSIWRNGSIYYLPQVSTLREQIKAHTIFDFLNGFSDEWWIISDILESRFATTLDLSRPISTLSGGELTKLFLAIGLSQEPTVLLLDEPTNHMDYLALEQLRQFLCQFEGAFVIVSHKPFFLDQVVNTIWELTPQGINTYGGNFSLYQAQKQTLLEAQWRSHEVAQKELKRAKAVAMREQERAAQSRRNGRLQRGSMPRIVAGAMKRKAEVTAGKLKQKHDAAIADATQKVAEIKIRTNKATHIHLEERSQKHKNLIEIQGADLWIVASEMPLREEQLLIQNIQLHIASGDRIAIAGTNGSGKSSLAKAVLEIPSAQTLFRNGEIRVAPHINIMYLDQTYELVNREQTALENMQATNPQLSYQLIRQQLGHFLFFNDDVHKPASILSGGELARLAIAMISIAAIDLLILDEPTNNLDIVTVNRVIEAVQAFQGALWVISHDLNFLSQIDITQSFILKHRTLQPTIHLPIESAQYYNELINANS